MNKDIQEKITRIKDLLYEQQCLDINEGVRFGCDCGCGGDYYLDHPEEWDRMVERDYEIDEEIQGLLEELELYSVEELDKLEGK